MLENYFRKPYALERFRASPAGSHLDSFAAALHQAGYGRVAGGVCIRYAAHFGRWTSGQDIALAGVDESTVEAFEEHLSACDCFGHRAGSHERAGAGVRGFLRHLRSTGVIENVVKACEVPSREREVRNGFLDWMRWHRGISESTIHTYESIVAAMQARLGSDTDTYTAQAVRAAVLDQSAGYGISRAKHTVTTTRMFLRYLAVMGRCSPYLCDAIPTVAHWRQTTLPQFLPPQEIEKLVASCEPAIRAGLRDRAILLLLARLGLRAGDIVNMRLSDIDWGSGSFRVAGKGRREVSLPLSQEVGDALLAYLEHDRPAVDHNQAFLTVRPPFRPFACSGAISAAVKRAIDRAGVSAPTRGAHLLRHSAATAMLRDGASLTGIGIVLRHQSIETTTLYARVDTRLLRQVAQPWPEAAGC